MTEATILLKLPLLNKLQERTDLITRLYKENNEKDLTLTYDVKQLQNIKIGRLCYSFIILWSNFSKRVTEFGATMTELNCRAYDLLLRAMLISEEYILYIQRPGEINRVIIPFSTWIYSKAWSDQDFYHVPYGSKKMLRDSFPLQQWSMANIRSFIQEYGLGILACVEFFYVPRVCLLSNRQLKELKSKTNAQKQELETVLQVSRITDAFIPI